MGKLSTKSYVVRAKVFGLMIIAIVIAIVYFTIAS